MRYINYKKNWNNKLGCKIHTTIRLHDPQLYEGMDVEERLNGKQIGLAEVLGKRSTNLGNIPIITIIQDTGYGYDDSIEIFRRFFKKATIKEAMETPVDLIYLRKI